VEDLMADQPLGTKRRWSAEPLFPDLFPDLEPQVIEVVKPAPHVKLPPNGTELRDEGMSRVWDNTPENWRVVAMTLLFQLAQRQAEVTTDDLWKVLPPLPEGCHPNVIGGLWMEAVRQHWLRRTDRMVISERQNAHARRVPVYESLVQKLPW